MAKYLDQAGLQLVLSKITNKYDGRYLGIHGTADAAEKVVHKLTINVRDEESRVFDGTQDFEINVAQASHMHPATEVTYANAAVTGAKNVNEALDIIVKNIQIGAAAISNATNNMQALQDALDQEKTDRETKDSELQGAIDALEDKVDKTLGNGNENIFTKLEAVKQELQGKIDAEADRAGRVEAGLREDVDDHESRLQTIEGTEEVEGSIKKAVKDERDRAMAAEGILRTAIETEKSQREQAVQDLADDLAEEVTNRLNAEEGLSNRITANKNAIDILNGDANQNGSVDKKVAEAEARVKVVTDALDGRVTSAESRLDVIQGTGEGSIAKAVADLVGAAPDVLDTLEELANALKNDPDIITVLENEYKEAIQKLEQKHDKEKKDLDDAIAKEVEDRETAVANEKSQREQADKELSDRLSVIEGIIEGDEGTTLKDIIEDIAENAQAIKTEKERAEREEALIKERLDVIEGTGDGSIKKAVADQAAVQLAKDNAQDLRMQAIEDKVGNDGGTAEESTGLVATLRGAIEAEVALRESEDDRLEGRIADIEGLIGGEEGSASLKELNDRLKEVEAEQITQNAAIQANAQAIAAIVALDEADIDAAFNAIFQ